LTFWLSCSLHSVISVSFTVGIYLKNTVWHSAKFWKTFETEWACLHTIGIYLQSATPKTTTECCYQFSTVSQENVQNWVVGIYLITSFFDTRNCYEILHPVFRLPHWKCRSWLVQLQRVGFYLEMSLKWPTTELFVRKFHIRPTSGFNQILYENFRWICCTVVLWFHHCPNYADRCQLTCPKDQLSEIWKGLGLG